MNRTGWWLPALALLGVVGCGEEAATNEPVIFNPGGGNANATPDAGGGVDGTGNLDGTDATDGSDPSNGSDSADGTDGSDGPDGSDGTDGDTLDAGADGADATDGGAGPTVPPDSPRSFRCEYDNKIAEGQLMMPIKGCKDFAEDWTREQAETACADVFPAKGTGVVYEGACDMTDAVGYCSDDMGGRDFAYHLDCNAETVGTGAWACAKVVPGATGWTCLDGTGPSDGTGGDGTDGTDGSDGPGSGDGKTYRCNYTNGLASDSVGETVLGCKEYRGGWTPETAEADCRALIQIDQDEPITFEEGECSRDGANGYCEDPATTDREFSYSGGCGDAQPSGKWACDTFVTGGTWECLLTEPDRKCELANAPRGTASCTSYKSGTTLAYAEGACDAAGGTLSEGRCAETGIVGKCTLANGNVRTYTSGYCNELETACSNAKGSFKCVDGPLAPVYSCRFQGCTNTGLLDIFGCAKGPICVDYPAIDGWTKDQAEAACDAHNATNTFAEDPAQSCLAATPAPTQRCKDNDGSFRYGTSTCSGSWWGDTFGAPKPDQGPFTDYNSACETAPTFQGVLTCRYVGSPVSGVTVDSCADFPVADGWTEQAVRDHCASQQGADVSTLEVVSNFSCLEELGQTGSASRCAVKADTKRWFPYGVPDNVCTSNLSGTPEKGPFCSDY